MAFARTARRATLAGFLVCARSRDNRSVAPSEHQRFAWRALNEDTHIASQAGQVVAVVYTVDGGSPGDPSLEFCWVPVDEPELVDVLFGVAPGAEQDPSALFGGPPSNRGAWESRWDRAHHAVEGLCTRRPAN